MIRATLTLLTLLPAALAAQDPPGKAVYDKWCAACHGDTGAGDGEAAATMLPRPRDFTRAVYQIRSTPSGAIPSDADLRRVIDEGMPGTAMPGWKSRLSDRERQDVTAYLKSFSRFFQGAAPEVLDFGRAPSGGAEAIAAGAEVYRQLECFKCHGDAGRGDGASAPTLTDDWDHPILAANLTQNWRFNGGGRVEDIYARLRTGLDGTPMPSFSDAIDGGVITDAQLWQVAHYVRSLSPAQAPRVREVIVAARTAAAPTEPADSAWADAQDFYVPLVGQIVEAPRWFAPMVEGVWIRALHDGTSLAIRVTWDDRSQSPDAAWQEWLADVQRTVFQEDTTALVHGPDRLRIQFPQRVTGETELPFFLGGDAKRPAHIWRWRSDAARLEVGAATGLARFRPGGTSDVSHAARFHQGQWQVVFRRALVPTDTATAPTFTPGTTIPVAFAAADGSSGEDDVRGSISAWYAIYLSVPTPGRVYIQPVIAALVTAGLGLFVVRRAQRRTNGSRDNEGEAP